MYKKCVAATVHAHATQARSLYQYWQTNYNLKITRCVNEKIHNTNKKLQRQVYQAGLARAAVTENVDVTMLSLLRSVERRAAVKERTVQ